MRDGCMESRVENVRLAYILAASHSGSTLLALLLGGHPEVCTVGELKFTSLGPIDKYRCSCREYIRDCPFWSGLSSDMSNLGFTFDVGNAGTDIRTVDSAYAKRLLVPLHRCRPLESLRDAALSLSAEWRRHLPKNQAINSLLARCICERTGKRVIVDSSKVGIRLKYLLKNPDIDVKVIRLVRDGRAVALTYMDPAKFADADDPVLRGGGTGGNRESEKLSISRAAMEWRRSNEEAECILGSLDRSGWMEVRYEDLCRDPAVTLNRIFEFTGLQKADALSMFRKGNHHVVGNGMRLDTTQEIRLDERWKGVLRGEELAVFETVAGAMNRKLGYV